MRLSISLAVAIGAAACGKASEPPATPQPPEVDRWEPIVVDRLVELRRWYRADSASTEARRSAIEVVVRRLQLFGVFASARWEGDELEIAVASVEPDWEATIDAIVGEPGRSVRLLPAVADSAAADSQREAIESDLASDPGSRARIYTAPSGLPQIEARPDELAELIAALEPPPGTAWLAEAEGPLGDATAHLLEIGGATDPIAVSSVDVRRNRITATFEVTVGLTASSSAAVLAATNGHLNEYVAIVLDDVVQWVAKVAEPLDGSELVVADTDEPSSDAEPPPEVIALAVGLATGPQPLALTPSGSRRLPPTSCGDGCARRCDDGDGWACVQEANRLGAGGNVVDAVARLAKACTAGVSRTCEPACVRGNPNSCSAVGTTLTDGPLIARDVIKGRTLRVAGCRRGDTAGCESLIEHVWRDRDTSAEAVDDLRRFTRLACDDDGDCERVCQLAEHSRTQCESGEAEHHPHVDATAADYCRNLAVMYEQGLGVARDPDRAARLRAKATRYEELASDALIRYSEQQRRAAEVDAGVADAGAPDAR